LYFAIKSFFKCVIVATNLQERVAAATFLLRLIYVVFLKGSLHYF